MNKIRTILLRTQKDTGEVIKEDDQDIDIENDKGGATPQATLQATPQATGQATGQATEYSEAERRIILVLDEEMKRAEIQEILGLKHRMNFIDNYLNPALENKYIEMTIPEIPNHQEQRYRLTIKEKY